MDKRIPETTHEQTCKQPLSVCIGIIQCFVPRSTFNNILKGIGIITVESLRSTLLTNNLLYQKNCRPENLQADLAHGYTVNS